MHVGIMTFHHARNYGALLQAYGLRKAIESLGHTAVVVNYVPEHFRNREIPWLRPGWRSLGLRKAVEMIARRYRFAKFRASALKTTPLCQDKDALARQISQLDAVVVGSDQVWNLNFVQSGDLCYFLDFQKADNVRRISYAACCGQKDQPPARLEQVAALLKDFHVIGVRNDATAEFVQSLTGRDSTIVADPTILTDFDLTGDIETPERGYILTYGIGDKPNDFYERTFSKLKQKLDVPVWAIGDADRVWADTPFPGADRNIFGILPGQFLTLYKNARFVVADSFHGTIFAVKYGIPFLSVNNGGPRNARLYDLATRYGLESRVKSYDDPIDLDFLTQTADLAAMQERFNAHRVASLVFLREALNGEGDRNES